MYLVAKRWRDNINIYWSIVAKVKGSTKINDCPLCLTEKYHLIEYFNDIRLLKKKIEFANACRHQNNLLLKNSKINDSMDWENIKETLIPPKPYTADVH